MSLWGHSLRTSDLQQVFNPEHLSFHLTHFKAKARLLCLQCSSSLIWMKILMQGPPAYVPSLPFHWFKKLFWCVYFKENKILYNFLFKLTCILSCIIFNTVMQTTRKAKYFIYGGWNEVRTFWLQDVEPSFQTNSDTSSILANFHSAVQDTPGDKTTSKTFSVLDPACYNTNLPVKMWLLVQ